MGRNNAGSDERSRSSSGHGARRLREGARRGCGRGRGGGHRGHLGDRALPLDDHPGDVARLADQDRSASAPGSPGRSPAARSCLPSPHSTSTRCRAGAFAWASAPGVKRLNERWHGVEYGRPAPHLRETVEATRLIMESANAGAPIRYEGSYHDIDIKGWTRPHPAFRDKVPIYVAAVGEGMARMAGDVADGALGHLICSTRWLEEVMVPNFEKGLARSGRERSDFDFIPGDVRGDRERRLGGRGGLRRGAKDARLLRDRAHLRAGVRDRRLRIPGRGGRQRVPRGRPGRRRRGGHGRDGRRLLRGRHDRQGAPEGRRSRGAGGLDLPGPPDLLHPPEEINEYQRRVLDAFGPANR